MQALDRIVLISMMLFSELLSALETVNTPNASSKFKSYIEQVIVKHPQVLAGFDFKWLELNAFTILDNLSRIEERLRREKCVMALFDLLQAAISYGEELGAQFEYLDKSALIYNVNHPMFEQYDLAKGIIHEKLVWFKKEKTKREENKKKVRLSLRYGNRLESTKIPGQIFNGVIEPKKITLKKMSLNSVRNILMNPIGTDSLRKEVSGVKRVAIIVDYNFNSLTSDILKLVLSELKNVQVPRVEVILTCGLNKLDPSQFTKMLGSKILDQYNISFHDALDENGLTEVGKTLSGASLKINTKVVEAEYRIAIGCIHPHPYSGFTGGYQAILPGVAGAEAIVCNQVRGTLLGSQIGSNADNPVFRDTQSVASLCRIDFLLNTIIDSRGGIVDLVAGNPGNAYAKGTEMSRKLFRVEVDKRAEVVVISPGKPYDQDLYTSLQSLGATKQLLKPNGLTILLSDISNEDLIKLKKIMAVKYDEFLDMAQKDPKALLMRNIMELEGRNLILVSGKSLKDVGRLPIINVDNLGEAIDQAMRIANPSSLLVVREAWNIIPEFKNGEHPYQIDF
ncbi:MAG: lactate racemase domain-containing protein [Candidatus Jordarchaeum sp.]|uniref:lactate racemase domain-containing protein n=1 Tax=Candidatus Jordarchaeum sp. TaxID=2823881 RepID=UPI00404A91DB